MLPPLIVAGFGIGLVMAPAMNVATYGVEAHDAGVASASVNAMQQVGGSIGTALLSTFASTAASHYLAGKNAVDPLVQAEAASGKSLRRQRTNHSTFGSPGLRGINGVG